jgi:endonuclease G, mitochondrial
MRLLLPFLVLATLQLHAQGDLDQRLRALEGRQQELDQQQRTLRQQVDSAKLAIIRRDLQRMGLPRMAEGEVPVVHPGHILLYDERHEQPRWTAHIAAPELTTGNLARIDSFLPDPAVTSGTAVTADYWNSGYDRGHMVPSADMRWNFDALKGTYYYSNVSPQLPELNRGSWAELEDWVRRYVNHSGRRVFVITGPVLRDGLPVLQNPGRVNEVSIPELFFKVIADLDGDEPKALAFIMRNGVNEYPPASYAVPVDSVEKLTGLDLFPALDDAVEQRIEAMRDPRAWYAQGDPFFGEAEPLKAPLPKGLFNTVQARHHVGKTATICGTVVSTRKTAKAKAIYLNFDRMHPHQDFYATIWEYNGPNFSYDPEQWLLHKKVCVTGKITEFDGIPRISINNEKEVVLFEEAVRGR